MAKIRRKPTTETTKTERKPRETDPMRILRGQLVSAMGAVYRASATADRLGVEVTSMGAAKVYIKLANENIVGLIDSGFVPAVVSKEIVVGDKVQMLKPPAEIPDLADLVVTVERILPRGYMVRTSHLEAFDGKVLLKVAKRAVKKVAGRAVETPTAMHERTEDEIEEMIESIETP